VFHSSRILPAPTGTPPEINDLGLLELQWAVVTVEGMHINLHYDERRLVVRRQLSISFEAASHRKFEYPVG
jgi:hypothetical protein